MSKLRCFRFFKKFRGLLRIQKKEVVLMIDDEIEDKFYVYIVEND